MTVLMMVLVAVSPAELPGFWHSEPDLDNGYETCYFFWENGDYACLESIEDGTLYTGRWYLTRDVLTLELLDAMRMDGTAVSVQAEEIPLTLEAPGGKPGRISLDGEMFYLVSGDPDNAIISLVPTYGMSASESDAFSTYD